ncbi:MAG: hypothetical protein GW855_06285 [Erythrobacter sp.]|nr:hypothetical protein [Erythrobacter sp.]NCQ64558.1 hypothetical protein [Alphaproteobacteria bacterium]
MKFLGMVAMVAAASSAQVAGGLIDYSWGMTPAQVLEHSEGTLKEGRSGSGFIDFRDYDNGIDYKVGNVGTITIFDRTMDTGFYYSDGKLGQIRTYRKEACPDFRFKLKARYGEPTKESDYPSGYYATWIDAASKTEIRLMASTDCRVFLVRKD